MSGLIGYGATFTVGSAIGGVIEISKGYSPEVNDVETTNTDNASTTKTYIPGLIEGGTVEVKTLYDATNYGAALALVGTPDQDCSYTLANGDEWSWTGYVKGVSMAAPQGDKVECTVTAKVSGVVDFSPAGEGEGP